jgi:transposase InsO family protein
VIGLFKAEVVAFFGRWKSVGKVEWETLRWVSWYNTQRLHGTMDHRPPQEMEDAFYASMIALDKVA